MQIRAIHTNNFIPLGSQILDFTKQWDNKIADRILLNGPNGCGKSSLLRAIALLWEGFGHWLHYREAPNQKIWPNRKWLQQHGSIALILDSFPLTEQPIVLFFGTADFLTTLQQTLPDSIFIGETLNGNKNHKKLTLPPETDLLNQWHEAKTKLLASHEPTILPNIIFLDAEARRWITPNKDIGKIVPDDSTQRWLKTYEVSEQWEGQLESSLISMKATDPQRFEKIINEINPFLNNKKILPTIQTGENRLKVSNIPTNESTYYIDELSAGEHQILIQIYLISRWLEQGGIVLIDEPDLHLHPALISGFLEQLERMVSARQGQLIITSHIPDVWKRYETRAKRFSLGVN